MLCRKLEHRERADEFLREWVPAEGFLTDARARKLLVVVLRQAFDDVATAAVKRARRARKWRGR